MKIAFYDRREAAATFWRHRRTWSRPAAWTLTLLHCARGPKVRLAAALAGRLWDPTASFSILPDSRRAIERVRRSEKLSICSMSRILNTGRKNDQ